MIVPQIKIIDSSNRTIQLFCIILSAFGTRGYVTPTTPVLGNTSATPTTAAPVVIVKQVNEIHEDGSYTVGFEAADGTFKMETRDAEGNVVGKLGIKLTYQ